MDAEEMRALLKRICKHGSTNAKSLGFDIDFEKCLYICQSFNVWHIYVANDKVNGPFKNDEECQECHGITLGANFMRYVPAIDRFESISKDVLMKSPVGRNYIKNERSKVMLPIVDEFAYKFAPKALEMILHAMMSNGSYAAVDPHDYKIYVSMLNDEDDRWHSQIKYTTLDSSGIQQRLNMFQEHLDRRDKILKLMQPIKISLVPCACSSFEELQIALDMADVE